jgi:hypothetical protein
MDMVLIGGACLGLFQATWPYKAPRLPLRHSSLFGMSGHGNRQEKPVKGKYEAGFGEERAG